MISKKFIKDSSIYTFIGALPLASSLVLLPFYAYFLDTSDFGLLALYIGFTIFCQILITLGFDLAIQIYYFDYKNEKEKLSEYVVSITIALIISGLIFLFILSIFGNLVFTLVPGFKSLHFYPYGIMCIITAICNALFKSYSNLLISMSRSTSFLSINIIGFILVISLSIGGLYFFPYSIEGPMWGRLLSGTGIFLIVGFLIFREFGFHFNFEIVKKTFSFSLPVFFFSIITWAISYADLYIINNYIKISEVGIYDFAIKCTLLIDFILNALSTAIATKIYTLWSEKKISHSTMEGNRYFNALTAISILTIAVNILIVPLIFPFIVKQQSYYESFAYIPFIAISYVWRGSYLMCNTPIAFFKKTKLLPLIYSILAVVKVVIAVFAIKFYGLMGAVLALFVVKTLEVVTLYLASRTFYNFEINKVKLIFLPLLYVSSVVLLENMSGIMNIHLLHLINLIFAVIIIVWVYKKELKILIDSLLKNKRVGI